MAKCKLSIIIPVYKVERYLPKCLESVEVQLSDECEVILVDDGSPDGCGGLCDAFAAKHPKNAKVIHQENKGLGGARNAGIREASGEYLFFLDSDDTIATDTAEVLFGEIEKTGADIILLSMNMVNESTGEITGQRGFPVEKSPFSAEMKEGVTFSPEAPLRVTKKSLFEENRIEFPLHVWYEDLRTTPKLYTAAKTVSYIEKPLYNYLERQGSIMHSADPEKTMEICDAMADLYAWFGEHGTAGTFREELDFMTADHLQYASARLAKSDCDVSYLKKIRAFINENCKNLSKNKYIKKMPVSRRIGLFLLRHGMFGMMKALYR